MGWQEVASGSALDLFAIGQYEDQLLEGSHNLLELYLRLPVSEGVAQTLEDTLRAAGVENVRVTTASPILKIYFTKGFPWLVVIAGAIIASIIVLGLVLSWKLSTEVPAAIPLIALAAIAIATVVGIFLVKGKSKREVDYGKKGR